MDMPWLYPVAMLLYSLALLYGFGAVGSLLLRASRLALARKWRHGMLCGVFILVVASAAVFFVQFVLGTRLAEWPAVRDIPYYVVFIGMCHYLANVAPKRWQP